MDREREGGGGGGGEEGLSLVGVDSEVQCRAGSPYLR